MAINRDLSAMVLARWPHPLRSVLDGLAATGAWGIRMAMEAPVVHMTLNDWSVTAGQLIRENLRRNGIDAAVRTGDVTTALKSVRADFVDIDPFGPPTSFLDAAFDSARPSSGLGITATDTAVLSGTYPEACERRYGARALRCPQGSELGLRILLGYCARLAGERGKSIRPILSFVAEHFVRTIVAVSNCKGSPPLGSVIRKDAGHFVRVGAKSPGAIGPLWMGLLAEPSRVREMVPSSWISDPAARLASRLQKESVLPPFFVTTDELAAQERGSPPRLAAFLDGLRALGFRAERTHFHPRGVKTDAPYPDVVRAFRERMPTGSTDDSGPAS